MAEYLKLASRTNYDIIPESSFPRILYLLFEIKMAKVEESQDLRLPVDLGLVVDISPSMRVPIVDQQQFEWLASQGHVQEVMVDGVPVWHVEQVPPSLAARLPNSLTFLRQALEMVAGKLGSEDRAGLVAFAARAEMLVAKEGPGEASTRNVGELLARAAGALQTLDLGDETCIAQGLALALEEMQRSKARDLVRRILLLTDGFTLHDDACRALARRAREAGIGISTLGLGVEFNEELLIELAETSGGHAYFAREATQVPGTFLKELERVEAITFRSLELKLKLTPGVELRRAFRVQPEISNLGDVPSEGGNVNLFLGDLEREAASAVLLELIVPPRAAGTYRLCQAVLAYQAPVAVPVLKLRQDVIVRYSDVPAACSAVPDPLVARQVERVIAFQLQTQALKQADSGDLTGATAKLRAAATRLLEMGEADLAHVTLAEARNLEQGKQMTLERRKELRYATRRLTRPL